MAGRGPGSSGGGRRAIVKLAHKLDNSLESIAQQLRECEGAAVPVWQALLVRCG